MKKIFLLFFLFCLLKVSLYAQDSSRATYRITTPVLQDIQLYFTLSGEKVLLKKTIGISIGYKPSTKVSGEGLYVNTGPSSTYQMSNFGNRLYSSFTIDFFMKFYFGKKGKSFLMPDVYQRLWWFNKKDCSFSGTGGRISDHYDYSYDGTRTEWQYLTGLKILYGRTYKLNKNGSCKPVIEPYAGIGFFVKSYVFQTYNGTVNDVYYNYYRETNTGFYPSVHIGLNIGLEFAVKKKE
ncbi:MAG: hypothetical protein ACTHJT_15545 [Cytophaga sp.]|uniref:hypothetical protein n=1 Tax=Cytophaga sp. TaxID=29535 RepID=UPI003F7EE43D